MGRPRDPADPPPVRRRSPAYDRAIRLLLADDHRLIIAGVRRALEQLPDFEVGGEGRYSLRFDRREGHREAVGQPEADDSPARADGRAERETAILTAFARGLSNEAIAKELWVAEQTVKFHLAKIYRELGVANRTEAARLAYQNGLVESPLDDH